MLRKLYDKVIALSESRQALPTLAAVSFAESSFFPIPPDVVLVHTHSPLICSTSCDSVSRQEK